LNQGRLHGFVPRARGGGGINLLDFPDAKSILKFSKEMGRI